MRECPICREPVELTVHEAVMNVQYLSHDGSRLKNVQAHIDCVAVDIGKKVSSSFPSHARKLLTDYYASVAGQTIRDLIPLSF